MLQIKRSSSLPSANIDDVQHGKSHTQVKAVVTTLLYRTFFAKPRWQTVWPDQFDWSFAGHKWRAPMTVSRCKTTWIMIVAQWRPLTSGRIWTGHNIVSNFTTFFVERLWFNFCKKCCPKIVSKLHFCDHFVWIVSTSFFYVYQSAPQSERSSRTHCEILIYTSLELEQPRNLGWFRRHVSSSELSESEKWLVFNFYFCVWNLKRRWCALVEHCMMDRNHVIVTTITYFVCTWHKSFGYHLSRDWNLVS